MAEFDVAAELDVVVNPDSVDSARQQIESELGEIGVDASGGMAPTGRQPRNPRTGRFMSQRGPEQRLIEMQALDEERNDLLEELVETTDQDFVNPAATSGIASQIPPGAAGAAGAAGGFFGMRAFFPGVFGKGGAGETQADVAPTGVADFLDALLDQLGIGSQPRPIGTAPRSAETSLQRAAATPTTPGPAARAMGDASGQGPGSAFEQAISDIQSGVTDFVSDLQSGANDFLSDLQSQAEGFLSQLDGKDRPIGTAPRSAKTSLQRAAATPTTPGPAARAMGGDLGPAFGSAGSGPEDAPEGFLEDPTQIGLGIAAGGAAVGGGAALGRLLGGGGSGGGGFGFPAPSIIAGRFLPGAGDLARRGGFLDGGRRQNQARTNQQRRETTVNNDVTVEVRDLGPIERSLRDLRRRLDDLESDITGSSTGRFRP